MYIERRIWFNSNKELKSGFGDTGHKADVIQKIISWLKWFPVWLQGVQNEKK